MVELVDIYNIVADYLAGLVREEIIRKYEILHR